MPNRRKILGGLGAMTTAGIAGCLDRDQPELSTWTPEPGTWPLTGYGPENTVYNPHADPPSSTVSEDWKRSLDGPISDILYAEGLLLCFGEGGIWAVDGETGDTVWNWDSPVTTAGIYDTTIYAGCHPTDETDSPTVRAFELASGEPQYITELPNDHHNFQTTVTTESYVLCGRSRSITVLDRVDGEQVWSIDQSDGGWIAVTDDGMFSCSSSVLSRHQPSRDFLGSELSRSWETVVTGLALGPAVSSNGIYVGTARHQHRERATIQEFDLSGERIWTSEPIGEVTGMPTVVPDEIVVGTHRGRGVDGQQVAINPDDGGQEWTRELDGWVERSIATRELILSYASHREREENRVFAQRLDGEVVWEYELENRRAGLRGLVAVNETVYTASRNGRIRMLSDL